MPFNISFTPVSKIIIILLLQMWRMRLREAKSPAQVHIAHPWGKGTREAWLLVDVPGRSAWASLSSASPSRGAQNPSRLWSCGRPELRDSASLGFVLGGVWLRSAVMRSWNSGSESWLCQRLAVYWSEGPQEGGVAFLCHCEAPRYGASKSLHKRGRKSY